VIADRYEGFIFDLDGTIYLGEQLLPGVKHLIQWLRGHGKKWVFLSNKPIQTRQSYAAKLTRLGVPTEVDRVINSSFVMARYLADNYPGARVYVIGEPPLINEIRSAGINTVENPVEVDCRVDFVIAAFDRTFEYAKLNNALQAIKKGARFIATNPDRTCPVEGGEIPDAGGVIGAIEGTTGKKLEMVVGKPSHIMVDVALNCLGVQAGRCLMVGDRLETDMVMGESAGIDTALVLTGITRREDLAQAGISPTYVLDGVRDLIAC